jgi:hypothetical protein
VPIQGQTPIFLQRSPKATLVHWLPWTPFCLSKLYLCNSAGSQVASSTKGAGAVDTASYVNGGSAAVTVYVRVR